MTTDLAQVYEQGHPPGAVRGSRLSEGAVLWAYRRIEAAVLSVTVAFVLISVPLLGALLLGGGWFSGWQIGAAALLVTIPFTVPVAYFSLLLILKWADASKWSPEISSEKWSWIPRRRAHRPRKLGSQEVPPGAYGGPLR
ncbi:MAG: hypothetical protein ACYDFT_00310 [Thermoplasmata archaeon]